MEKPSHAGQTAGTSPCSSRSTAPNISETDPAFGSSASDAAAALAADAKDAAWTVAQAMQEQSTQLAQNVGRELKQTAENQKTRGVDTIHCLARAINTIHCFARAIKRAADELESQTPGIARSVHDAARKIDGLSENIGNRNMDELISAVSESARLQPMLFMGGTVMAGLAFARFFKSSASSHANTETMPAGGPRPLPGQR
jgi:hypothetical protein